MKNYILILSAATLLFSACESDDKVVFGPDVPMAATPVQVLVAEADYRPAPGQFVNELPAFTEGDDAAAMNAKVVEWINKGQEVSLGSFGGSVTLKLSAPIVNLPDKADFIVYGNAFNGCAEPGIVEVSSDGIIWYALRGEKWDESIADFSVTYFPPSADATNSQYIRWESTDGQSGWINRNTEYHTQSFFPLWLSEQSMNFTARRLPDNGYLNTMTGLYVLQPYWGYVDSYPNNTLEAWLELDNAVDADGNPVKIDSVSYLRITTGVLQCNGALGECSTEIRSIWKNVSL